jgi:hypothetical protein
MSTRARFYVVAVVCALAPAPLTLIAKAGEWSNVAFYGTGAVLLLVICAVGMFWVEMAPDGAFRREPRR